MGGENCCAYEGAKVTRRLIISQQKLYFEGQFSDRTAINTDIFYGS